jgi:hypothetical protein
VAEDLAETLPVPAQRRPATRRRPALRGRFLVAYLVLGVLGGAALAGAVVLFTQAERDENLGWADWHPVGDNATYVKQIADHVAVRYRQANGDQVVGVVAGPPELRAPDGPTVEVAAVLIRSFNSESESDIRTLRTDDSYLYQLCGLGDRCVVEGTPTEERHRLLRREALELALYTFKYLEGAKIVIALMPPVNAEKLPTAVFFEREHFEPELDRPLAETIEQPEKATLVEVPELETVKVDRLTLPFVFDYTYELLPNETAALILTPVTSEG